MIIKTLPLLVSLLLLTASSNPARAGATDPIAGACQPPRPRLWRLTPSQYINVLRAALPGVPFRDGLFAQTLQSTGKRFDNEPGHLELSLAHVDQVASAVGEIAGRAAQTRASLDRCLVNLADQACLSRFIEGLVTRATRRPASTENVSALLAFFAARTATTGSVGAFADTISRALLSPEVIFRPELGVAIRGVASERTLDSYERASALSFFVLDGPPDAQLWAAARRNELATAEGMATQARRLLSVPSAGLMRFLEQKLEIDHLPVRTKAPGMHPLFPKDSMLAETRAFLRHHIWSAEGTVASLFTAEQTFVDRPLAEFYGLDVIVPDGNLQAVVLDGRERMGLLTQASILAVTASDFDTDPVVRGKYVREKLLCQPLPPPPVGLVVEPPKRDGRRSQRELHIRHSADPACRGCHALMDDLGLALEMFDAAGRFRTIENGRRIDPAGVLRGTSVDGRFSGPQELARLLAIAPETAACMAEDMQRYALGPAPGTAEGCAPADLARASGGRLRDMALAIVKSRAFLNRSVKP